MLSEVSQSVKDNHHVVSLIWVISKIVKGIIGERRENEWEKSERVTKHERLLSLGNEQGVVEEEAGGRMDDWVTGTEGGT